MDYNQRIGIINLASESTFRTQDLVDHLSKIVGPPDHMNPDSQKLLLDLEEEEATPILLDFD